MVLMNLWTYCNKENSFVIIHVNTYTKYKLKNTQQIVENRNYKLSAMIAKCNF